MAKMIVDVMTLFPEIFDLTMKIGVVGRAIKKGIIDLYCHQIRDFSDDKHRRVDDYPYGGGDGMIMSPEPIFRTFMHIKEVRNCNPYVVMMSPKGKVLDTDIIKRVRNIENLAILCGRYEGIDQRVIDELVDEEISIGNYVVSGGELPSMIFLDAVFRTIDGVLSSPSCYENESHYNHGVLEHPQFTRPPIWHNKKVPDVLLSGNHHKINEWRARYNINNRKDTQN